MYCNTNKKYFQYKNCICTKKLFSNKYNYTIWKHVKGVPSMSHIYKYNVTVHRKLY